MCVRARVCVCVCACACACAHLFALQQVSINKPTTGTVLFHLLDRLLCSVCVCVCVCARTRTGACVYV